MTQMNVLGMLIILPALVQRALALAPELEVMAERLQRIHDIDSFYEEVSAAGESALTTIGIVPVVYLFSDRVERFLGEHKDFAQEFGPFARRASYLAKMYVYKMHLDKDEHGPEAVKELAGAIAHFEKWLEGMRLRGLVAYDPEEEPRYVKPGVDPSTEDLRAVVRLRHNQYAEVPEDPIAGGEIFVHVNLPTKILGILCMAPSGLEAATVEKFLRLLRYVGALFRLSFRHPESMHFEDNDRKLVIEYLEDTFRDMRAAVEKGEWSPTNWQMDAASLERILEWKQHREREEL